LIHTMSEKAITKSSEFTFFLSRFFPEFTDEVNFA
jgi:hypothetical protein